LKLQAADDSATNSALIRFVAGYLADHAARANTGDGALGRVRIDPAPGHSFELRFEADRCLVELDAADAVDCHVDSL
jgi:hypothetical protein